MKAARQRTNPAPSARAIQRSRNAPTLARAIAAEERTIQRLIEHDGTIEISLSDYRKLVAGLSERGAQIVPSSDAALRQIAALCDDGDADAMTRHAARIAKAAMRKPAPPCSGTKHFWIEWNWDDGRFSTQADLTEEQARQIETLLEARSQQTQDIHKPEVWEPSTVYFTFDEVRKEIGEALGEDTCPTCFVSLDDDLEHDCPGKIAAASV
jgi:hypothetical protein